MGSRVDYGGLVIAGVGFFLTRFTVTLAIYEQPARFYLAGVVPLVLGLGLAAFGVALAVADVEAELVRTTALWCVVGVVTMLVLVVLTLFGSTSGRMPALATVRSRAYLSNFLIGGAIGGTLTGLYAARNDRHREELRQQANRLTVLNRVLRHEVLNGLTLIRGYAELGSEGDPEAQAVVEERTADVEGLIDEVKHLTRSARTDDRARATVDVEAPLLESVRAVRAAHPDATVEVGPIPDDATARANERVERVFTHLLDNAVVHGGEDPDVAVAVETTPDAVRVTVRDDGPGLPERQRALLQSGEIGEFDDPDAGFGLNVVRLLVESYRGSVETDVGEDGTAITVVLARGDHAARGLRPSPGDLAGVRPALPHLVVTLAAALVAGVAYGLAAELFGGDVSVIGVLYGARSPVVGWITHQFHSVVFGFAFAGLLAVAPARHREDPVGHLAVGAAWSVFLWAFAAGVVSPVWLRLLGVSAPVPSLSPMLLVSHLAWGVTLALLTAVGYDRAVPWLARRTGRGRLSGG